MGQTGSEIKSPKRNNVSWQHIFTNFYRRAAMRAQHPETQENSLVRVVIWQILP